MTGADYIFVGIMIILVVLLVFVSKDKEDKNINVNVYTEKNNTGLVQPGSKNIKENKKNKIGEIPIETPDRAKSWKDVKITDSFDG